MKAEAILLKFQEIALSPAAQKDAYLKAGKKIIIMAPVYTPEELVHSMELVPMGVWGADMELKSAKSYFPAFICSIMQSILESGIKDVYDGVSGIVIPSLCDSLKTLGENWKYAVPSIPFIPMTYPQNRKPSYGKAFTKAGYKRVIKDLEKATGQTFSEEKLAASIRVYNEHNQIMRKLADVLSVHDEISAVQRNAIYKSAFFMRKEEHTALVQQLLDALEPKNERAEKIRIMTTGILSDCPSLLRMFDEYGMHIVADDVAAESRQYRQDTTGEAPALDGLAEKFAATGNCSLLYDEEKGRVSYIVDTAKERKAQGVVVVLTKFCDSEEFDYPLIKKACETAGIPVLLIEVDRQMVNYEQARTMLETFRTMISQ